MAYNKLQKLQDNLQAITIALSLEREGREATEQELTNQYSFGPREDIQKMLVQSEDKKVEESPIMKQFHDLKVKHPDALLLFRTGDFYETYEADAKEASRLLGITLMYRKGHSSLDGDTYAMAGFPFHALDTYLPKLIRAGKRVAICDQLEAPKQTAKRGITEKVNPGLRTQLVETMADVKAVLPHQAMLRDALIERMREARIKVNTNVADGERVLAQENGHTREMSRSQKRAMETASVSHDEEHQHAVISFADGAKVRNNLETLANFLEKVSNQRKNFIQEVANALGAESDGSKSEYKSFGTKNGLIVTIRLADHNATVSNFDHRNEFEGISIVVTPKKNEGIINDGKAHIVEYYYDPIKLRKAEGKPLADIVKSIEQVMYSGEYKDTTGLAEREEVNAPLYLLHEQRVISLSADEIKEKIGTRLTNNNYTKVRSINPFVMLLHSDSIPDSLHYREVFTTPSLDDYFINTTANFEYIGSHLAMQPGALVAAEHENQQRWLDMVASGKYEHQKSPRSNSEYLLDHETGDIYRYSNHWGRVASCQWSIDTRYGTEDTEIYGIGKCNIKDFCINKEFSSYLADNPAYAPAYADALQKTIFNYETLLSCDIEMTDFVRTRLESVLSDYKKLFDRYQEDGYKIPKYGNVRYMLVPDSQLMFFRSGEHQAYGFVHNGTIYIDPRIATAETPLHEYTHLWAEVMRQQNPKEWENIVSLMKGNHELWQDVTDRYSHLTDENDIAEEVLAHYSGKRGFERMEEEYRNHPGLDKDNITSIFDTLSDALSRLWSFVADFLHIHYTSKEQVADQILRDALNGVNPLDYRLADAEKVSNQIIRPHFIGEKGARNIGLSRGDGFMFMTRLLESAKDYEQRGYDALRIKQITGWERGADGKWRSELSGVRVKSMDVGTNTVLSDVVDAPDLFKAYPELKDVRVEIGGIFDNGQYNAETNTITLNEIYRSTEVTKEQYEEVLAVNEQSIDDAESAISAGINTEYNKSLLEELHMLKDSVGEQAASARSIDEIWPDINSVVAHEVQHVIQHIEGFAVGGNLRTVANMRLESAQAEMDKYQSVYDEYKLLEDRSLYTDNISEVMYYIREMDKYEAEHGDELKAYLAARTSRDAAEMNIVAGALSEKNFDEYRRLAGEVEARNVSRRAEMTALERRNTLAASTEDIDRESQIIRFGSLDVAAQTAMPVTNNTLSRQALFQQQEAAGAMVDHLRAMGIDVVINSHESRRTLREAAKDQSEAGKVRHFKTENGESYGFAYRGKIHLDLRKLNTELSLHEFAHLWCEAMRRINPQNWSNTVAVIKNDADTWNYVKAAYPELQDENDLVEEVIAHYSGKRGAEKLEAELQRMTPKDANYGSRWGNIFQNISKTIQDFWKHTGDSLNVEYKNADDVADMILKDFAQKISPVKKLERYLQEQDKEYAAAVAAGDMDKARELFAAALQENVGNGVTPFVAVDGYRGKMDQLARNVKSDDFAVWREAVNEAADRMAPLIDSFAPDKAVLVPAPSHEGKATNMLPLANAISHRTGIAVADVLVSEPRQSQYEAKRETGKPLSPEQLGIRMEGELPQGKLPIVIDNVVSSGNTAEACIKALGKGMVLSVASATSQERHVASLKSAAAVVYDKQGNLIPLSERFEIKNKWLGRVMNYKPDQQLTVIAGLENYSEQEIHKYVREHFETMLEGSDIDAAIVDMKVIGSRVNGNSGEDSDLDVLLEFKGDVSEDALFNILNDDEEGRLYIEGIPVDINPITEGKSGTIQEFLERNKDYVKIIDTKNDIAMEENEKLQATINDVTSRSEQFRYRLLDRMRTDCDYFLGNGNRFEGNLWAGNAKDQIAVMRALWDSVPEKPEWLTKEKLDSYAEKMTTPEKSMQERLADVKTEVQVLTDMYGLEYTPVILPQRVFVADDNHPDGEVSYGNATVMGSDIELYDSILDSYDARNGVSLSELSEEKQLEVLVQLRDKLQDESRQLSVYVNTEQVPDYALSAIVNGDFSGIEDDEDRQNIEEFLDKYAGMTFSVRDEQPSFTNSPAFGKAVDCVPVDIIDITTTGALRMQQLKKIAQEQQTKNEQKETVQVPSYTTEEAAIVKAALGDHLQKVVNDYYGNGDVHNTEIKDFINGVDIANVEQAKDVAYNISKDVLSKAEENSPGIINRYTGYDGEDIVTHEATNMAQEAMKYAEAVLYNKQNNMEKQLDDKITRLNAVVNEYNDVLRDADPNYDIFNKPVQFYSIEKNDDDHFALIAHDTETGKYVTSWESASTIASKIDAVQFELSANMPGLREAAAERQANSEFREAKGYLDDVISEALPNVDDKIEIRPTTVFNGDDTFTITGLYHEKVDGQHHFLASSKTQNVTVDIDTIIHDVSSAEDLVTAVREAQIVQLLGTGGIDFVQRTGGPQRIENDSLTREAVYIREIQSRDGKVTIDGAIDNDGVPVYVKDFKDLGRDGIDNLFAEVRDVVQWTPELNLTIDQALMVADHHGLHSEVELDLLQGMLPELALQKHHIMPTADMLAKIEQMNDPDQVPVVDAVPMLLGKVIPNDGDEMMLDYGGAQLDFQYVGFGYQQLDGVKSIKHVGDGYIASNGEQTIDVSRLASGPDADYFLEVIKDNVKRLEDKAMSEEKKQEEVQAQQQEQQPEQKKRGWNIDYTKYAMPEGVNVEKAQVFKLDRGENAGKYAVSAVVDGQRKTQVLYKNDVDAYFSKDEKGERKATVEQLVAKYFSKSTAEKMGKSAADIDSVGELENAAAEAHENVAEEQAAEKKAEKERQAQETEEKKHEDEQKKEDKQDVSAGLALQTALLVGALQSASEHDGVWMNQAGKQAPVFWPKENKPSAFNSIVMALHSDANDYKTNMYTTFATAKREGISVRGKEKGLPYNWDDWSKFENKFNKNDVIDREKYLTLDPQEKELYQVQFRKEMRPIFNIDQTTLPMAKKEAYNFLVQVEDKEGVQTDQQRDPQVVRAEQVAEVRANHPDALLLFREDKNYVMYGEDAKKSATVLGLSVVKPDGEDIKTEDISLSFPLEELDTHLPKLIGDGNRVAICDDIESSRLHQLTPAEEVYAASERLISAIGNAGSEVNTDMAFSQFDTEKDALNLARRPAAVPGQEMTQAMEYANDAYRAAVAYTGTSDRLNRGARMNMLPEDRDKYDRLVQELTAGVMMTRQGLPAAISKENRDLIPYWERELKEDPKLLDAVERDVNKAVQVLDKIAAGEKVDYAVLRGERQMETVRPRLYTIASELAAIPNAETKQVVIVRDLSDPKSKKAAVILPAGASLEMNNEVAGMNKNRFVIALRKEGIEAENVKFYNAGGALGLNQPNEFFANKQVEVAHLKQYELIQDESIDLTAELARTSKVDIEKVSVIKNDQNEWVFYVKPTEGESVTIKPEAADLSKFFSAIKTEKFDEVREEMGQKYYALSQQHPELKQDFLMPKVENIDLDRIKSASIFKSKYDESKVVISCVYDDNQKATTLIDRDSKEWQRLWLVDDKTGYKVAVAAQLFKEELDKGQKQEVVETQEQVLTKTKEVVVDNDQEEVDEEQQTTTRGFHR